MIFIVITTFSHYVQLIKDKELHKEVSPVQCMKQLEKIVDKEP